MFDFGMARYLANIQNGLLLHQAGLLDKETVAMISDQMLLCIRSPGGRRWWQHTPMALPETREYVDQRIAHEHENVQTLAELMPHFMALAGEDTQGNA